MAWNPHSVRWIWTITPYKPAVPTPRSAAGWRRGHYGIGRPNPRYSSPGRWPPPPPPYLLLLPARGLREGYLTRAAPPGSGWRVI